MTDIQLDSQMAMGEQESQKKTKKRLNLKEATAAFNNIKAARQLKGHMTWAEVKQALIDAGFPQSSDFMKIFREKAPMEILGNNVIWKKDSRGEYMPISIHYFETIYREFRNKRNKYIAKLKAKTAETEVEVITPKPAFTIEEAIMLLKSAGYKVLKPDIQYVEV